MRNDIAKILEPVLILTNAVLSGFKLVGPDLVFNHHTREVIKADYDALQTSQYDYLVAKADLALRRRELGEIAKEVKAFATIARDICKVHLGNQWSSRWVGTPHEGSLAILIKPEVLEDLILRWEGYLKSHPERESADMKVSAQRAEELYQRIKGARHAVIHQDVVMGEMLGVRNEKFQAMRKRLRGFINELGLLIDPVDQRWCVFGLNKPGVKARPEPIEKVEVWMETEEKVSLKWKRPARAERYHVCQRKAGTEEPFVRVQTVRGTACWVERSAEDFEIAICPVNSGGESRLSEVIRISALGGGSQPNDPTSAAIGDTIPTEVNDFSKRQHNP